VQFRNPIGLVPLYNLLHDWMVPARSLCPGSPIQNLLAALGRRLLRKRRSRFLSLASLGLFNGRPDLEVYGDRLTPLCPYRERNTMQHMASRRRENHQICGFCKRLQHSETFSFSLVMSRSTVRARSWPPQKFLQKAGKTRAPVGYRSSFAPVFTPTRAVCLGGHPPDPALGRLPSPGRCVCPLRAFAWA
jgi:hypothetical protein